MSLASMLIDAHKKRIQNNPFNLSGNLYPLKSDGYEGFIEDKNGVPVLKTYTNPVRISTRKPWTMEKKDGETPVNTDIFVWYMVSDNKTIIDVRLYFTYNEFNFKVTNRKVLRKHGFLFGHEYELEDVTEGVFNA